MKGMCLLVIAFGLFISYQSNPLGTILIGGGAIIVYAIFKFRKNKSMTRRRGGLFRKGTGSIQTPLEDLVSLLVVQNLLGKDPHPYDVPPKQKLGQKENEIERIKQEVLALFDEA
jgi:hypothetical protein